ncbi:methyltransferase domain-containing protein [Paenibacillus tarimensis]|uniref:methyltransferase domain-containing protein n=1 Tax=Paenibacillus tarimensis TaxID=416012 RepID=UPI001F2E4A25|nr:methyltransferase domain-containing protein [Paenibacillus tarimensis]MCF2944808.1 methyltransferase domain-containing protein [Paenibacillus tarimensis]
MPLFKPLRQRAARAELMDDFSLGGEELKGALQKLRILNRIFLASSPTLHGVQKLWQDAGKPQALSILDIGAGSGDVNRRLLKWADGCGVRLRITLADITEEACEEARAYYRSEPRVKVTRRDLFELPEEEADIVTATQLVHHFDGGVLPAAVHAMLSASRIGVVINDIHRHWLPWAAVWTAARLLTTNRYIRHDGPLSVAKGFRAEDWRRLGAELGRPDLYYSWRPLFRYAVVISSSAKQDEGRRGKGHDARV